MDHYLIIQVYQNKKYLPFDAVADCTVDGGVHRPVEAGILSEVDVSHPMVAVPCKQVFRCAPVLWN